MQTNNSETYGASPNDHVDMFPALTENNPERIISLSISFCFSFVSVPFLYGIIKFESFGSDKKRSVLNIFTSMICWTLIALSLVIKIPEALRFIYGPMPDMFCCIQHASRYYIAPTIMLYYDAIAVARYIYIFWLKNPAGFDDQFWGFFIIICINMFTVLFTITIFSLIECKNMAYFLCTGKISSEPLENMTLRGMSIIAITTVVLHLVINVRVTVHRRKVIKAHLQPQMMSNSTKAVNSIETRSVSSVAANLLGICVAVLVLFSFYKLNQIQLEDLNDYPNYVLAYFVYLVSPNILVIVFIAASYRKEALRKFIQKEINGFLT